MNSDNSDGPDKVYKADAIIGGTIAIYIIYSAYGLIKEGVLMLLDVSLDEKMVEDIKQILLNEPEATDFHFLKTRSSGNINFVDVHLVFYPEISLLKAHDAADNAENKIKALDRKKEWAITIHLDPYDDSKENAAWKPSKSYLILAKKS